VKTRYQWAIALTVVLIIVLIAIANAAPTGSCGDGLGAQDLSGECRVVKPCADDPAKFCITAGALVEVASTIKPPKPGGVRLVPPKPGGVVVQP
jgi:hypothetical protein